MIDKFTTSPNTAGTSRRILVICLALLIEAVGVYSNHFHNDFHFDDAYTIVNNIFIRDLRNIPLMFKDGTTHSSLPTNQAYRPLVTATFAIDYWLGKGLNPFYFHLTSFSFFAVQGVLMFFVFLKLFNLSQPRYRNDLIAAFAASWYLLHPAIAETVNYIYARTDILSTFCVVLGFVMYLYSQVLRRYYLYLVPIAIGAFAKPLAVMFGPLFFFYLLLFEQKLSLGDVFRRRNRSLVISVIKTSLPSVLFCACLFAFTQKMTPATWIPGGYSRFLYLITQPFILLHYVTTFFLPTTLSADTDWTLVGSILDFRVFVGTIFILILVCIAVTTSRRENLRPISFGIVWFFLALMPTSSIIPLSEVMNDHRLFFPYIGLVMSVCWAGAVVFDEVKKRYLPSWNSQPSVVVLGLLLLCGYARGTLLRNEVWKTEESLWRDVTIKSPNNGRGLMNYGNTLMAKGDLKQALDYFHLAQRLTPQYSILFIDLAIAEGATGQPVKAEQDFKQALQLAPDNPNSYSYYARWLLAQSRVGEAVGLLRKALKLSPGDVFTLGLMHSAQAQLTTTPETCLSLSVKYYYEKRYGESIAAAEQALKLRPDYAAAYNNICAAYNQLGQYEKAVAAGEQALCYQPDFPLASNNLQYARQRLGVQ